MASRMPRLIAFDLESVRPTYLNNGPEFTNTHCLALSYTLWDLWVDTHVSGKFTAVRVGDGV